MRVLGLLLLTYVLTAPSQATPFDAPVYHYQGALKVDPDTGHIAADWQIDLLAGQSGALTFVLAPSLGNIAVSGDVTGFETGEQGPFQSLTIQLEDDARQIGIRYDGVLLPEPMDNDINAISPERVELTIDSFWLPVDAGFRGFFTADLTVDVGAAWRAVANGEVTQLPTGARIINSGPSLDIAFTLAPDFRVSGQEGYTLFDLRDHDEGRDRLIVAADFCLDYLNARFGARDPLPQISFVIHRRSESAYNRRAYITLTDISDTPDDRLTQFVCHELAHHWSAGADFMTVENWLNESFAEYTGVMALRERHGEAAFLDRMNGFRDQVAGQDLPPVWVPGATERRPYLVNYRAEPIALWHLETCLGRPAFEAFLVRYMVDGIDTTPDLLAMLEEVAGTEARDWFEGRLAVSDG
ncbi:MAG: hypothetical protein GC188_10065 [Alphaproteobacteria bacterium]|nr:hypothetical protein [Alphaproteobacteria bacterium]